MHSASCQYLLLSSTACSKNPDYSLAHCGPGHQHCSYLSSGPARRIKSFITGVAVVVEAQVAQSAQLSLQGSLVWSSHTQCSPEELWNNWRALDYTMLLCEWQVMQTLVGVIISFLFLSLPLNDSLY